MGDDLITTLRALVALAGVLALVLWLGRKARNGTLGSPTLRRGQGKEHLRVIARHGVGGRAQVALVEVGGRHIVLGVTEQQVSMLTEIDLDTDIDPDTIDHLDDQVTTPSDPAARKPQDPSPRGPLHGSILDPSTWAKVGAGVREGTFKS